MTLEIEGHFPNVVYIQTHTGQLILLMATKNGHIFLGPWYGWALWYAECTSKPGFTPWQPPLLGCSEKKIQ